MEVLRGRDGRDGRDGEKGEKGDAPPWYDSAYIDKNMYIYIASSSQIDCVSENWVQCTCGSYKATDMYGDFILY